MVFVFLFLFLLRAALLSYAVADDWPQFLGPRRDGTSAETGLVERWPESGPPLLWERTIGTGYGAPSVRDGKLVLHHRVRNEELVECLEAGTGKSLWRYTYPTGYEDPYGYNNGPRCTPLLTPDRCYTFGAEGKILCLDLGTGTLIWQRDTAKDWDIPSAFFGVGSTPILEANKLIVMIGGQPNSGVIALDPGTGRTIWESVGEKNWQDQPMRGWPGDRTVVWKKWEKQASYASPVAATLNGQRQIFCLMRQGLVSVNPTNGAVNFSRWFRAQVEESVNAASPVVADDLVFISSAYYRTGSLLLRVKTGGLEFDEPWKGTVLEIHWNTPILHDGFLYAFSGRNEPDARFRCVEFKTGKLRWDRDESWPSHSSRTPPVYGRGSAILADGKLIVLGEGGLLGMFRVNPARPEEIARWQAPQLSYPCWAAPVLSSRRLYLRNEQHLLCFNLSN